MVIGQEHATPISTAVSSDLFIAGPKEISLLDVFAILATRKQLIASVVAASAALTGLVLWFLPPRYQAEAVILAPQQAQSSLALLAAGLGGGGIAGSGLASQLGMKSQGDIYIGILKSRTVGDDIVHQFHLDQVYRKSKPGARTRLQTNLSVEVGKDSLIHIQVRDGDKKRAADLANAFVDELYKQNSRLALTEAGQRRMFFEQQLVAEKNALADAEIALKQTQQNTGLILPAGQAEALIRSDAQLRAEIMSSEVRLQSMESYATAENPEVQLLKKELSALKSQLRNVQSGPQNTEVSTGKLPETGLQFMRKARDVKYHEMLFELLSKQYEVARIDESKMAPLIQVVDRAVPADHKYGPPDFVFVLAAAAISGFICCLVVIVKHSAVFATKRSLAV